MKMRRPSIDIEAIPLTKEMVKAMSGVETTEPMFLTSWPNGSQLILAKVVLDKDGFFEVKRKRKKPEVKAKKKNSVTVNTATPTLSYSDETPE